MGHTASRFAASMPTEIFQSDRGRPNQCPNTFHMDLTNSTKTKNLSVCSGSQLSPEKREKFNVQSQRSVVTAGTKLNAPYGLQANHRGVYFWILAPASCGDQWFCFDPNLTNGTRILEFDDDCTSPTVNKTWRAMNLEPGQKASAYPPQIKAGQPVWAGGYFGVKDSPFGEEFEENNSLHCIHCL